MKKKNIRNNILPLDSSLRDVLNTLNKGVFGVVFIADQEGCIKGIFTDGDARRSILDGADLSAKVQNHMKKDFIFAYEDEPRENRIRKLTEKVRHLPVLNARGQLVDFLSWAEMWRLPIMEPTLGGNELKYVTDCITSSWISSQGSYVTAFEKEFAAYHDMNFALTTSSGTTALHLALVALGIGPGDEVIVPNLTFGASANTVVHTGAKPVFVDVDEQYWNLDPGKIEAAITPATKAIMPVHLYGHPCDMDPVMDIAENHGLKVVEDCAEALGARYRGSRVGTFGHVSCFSFFSNKVITTGEGGMVMTDDVDLWEKMMLWRDHGMLKKRRYWHEVPGFNYRMTNLQAAVGLAQLEQIDTFLENRRLMARTYTSCLKDVRGISLPPNMEWAENIYWLYSILVDEEILGVSRDTLRNELEKEGIETRLFFYPIHLQPPYRGKTADFPVADKVSKRGLCLPSSNGLSEDEIKNVCAAIRKIVEHYNVIETANHHGVS